MKSLSAFLITFFVVVNTFAAGPFDPKVCVGAPISANRILTLLGADSSYSLPSAPIEKRYRNVVNGVAGSWYAAKNSVEKVDFAASLGVNHLGNPVIGITARSYGTMVCLVHVDGTLECDNRGNLLKSSYSTAEEYVGYMTDNCLVAISKQVEPSKETEWGFTFNF